jgi:glutamyl-tRNA(Gln) amidotransferase subunit E
MAENLGVGKSGIDLRSIDLKVGLEVHQQLATPTKLFRACHPFSDESQAPDLSKSPYFTRVLRPVTSELGEYDVAAQFESRKEVIVNYIAPLESSCLVECDEEPPHPISNEALETSLIFALALESRIVDEIHVMRKIVVDGSNTSGFQRTAVVALGGVLRYGRGKQVAVQSISVEEDAARAVKLGREDMVGDRTYALDRLGSPLVEVALAPIEGLPEDAEEAASTLGKLMRSTGRVARGLGTIRQDLNISVMGGSVIEVKGVQRLDQFRKVIGYEASRQKFYFDLANEVREKLGDELKISETVVTEVFRNTASKILSKSLSEKASEIICIAIQGFKGFIGRENEFHARLGKELGAIAKSYGLGGVFHSDELPNYGITSEEVASLRSHLNMKDDDAFVLVAGTDQKIMNVAAALISRLKSVVLGVPAETRAASIDGETTFLRPRPGSARMYPETDIPLIQISENRRHKLGQMIPEPWEKLVLDFSSKYGLAPQLGEPLFDSDRKELFEQLISETSLTPSFVASALIDTYLALSRAGVNLDSLVEEKVFEMFVALNEGRFAKEAVQDILREMAASPDLSLEEILKRTGYSRIDQEELQKIVQEVLTQNLDLVQSKGPDGARSALMGKVMQRVRGKADGKEVSEVLSASLASLKQK